MLLVFLSDETLNPGFLFYFKWKVLRIFFVKTEEKKKLDFYDNKQDGST